ncbi:MAG: chemoreceptor glutamine deamidase CheD [Steroidobacteraceae bacterium]|nr:chemoreceptor glutamine deamidase CheD [Deltaproteobacteria bacterium]
MHRGRYFSTSSYYDRIFAAKAVKILPGQYHATGDGTVITTVLGSCVSVCLYDAVNGVGGMNHYMLPSDAGALRNYGNGSARYGNHAMNLLLEHVLQLGGKRANLEAKVFGAGRVMEGMSDVGRQNASFALRYLKEQKIRVVAVDVGDTFPRKICFSPVSGQVFVKRIQPQPLSPELFAPLYVKTAG